METQGACAACEVEDTEKEWRETKQGSRLFCVDFIACIDRMHKYNRDKIEKMKLAAIEKKAKKGE